MQLLKAQGSSTREERSRLQLEQNRSTTSAPGTAPVQVLMQHNLIERGSSDGVSKIASCELRPVACIRRIVRRDLCGQSDGASGGMRSQRPGALLNEAPKTR